MSRPPPPRVFIVDNDHEQLRSLTAWLEFKGYAARGASGGDVLGELRTFAAEAVVLNMNAKVDGYRIARELRSLYGGAKPVLIAVIPTHGRKERELAKLAGFDHCVAPSYQRGELVRLLAPLGPQPNAD